MKLLLFGATGSAGGSVLRVCLGSPSVHEVRVIGRREPRVHSAKLRSYLHNDFLDYRTVREAFAGADACFFCLGISVTAVSGEAEYRRITQHYAVAASQTLNAESPRAVFHYLSGEGAHQSSRFMWARVKAEAEEELLATTHAVCWRPSAIDGEPSDHAPRAYQLFRPYFRVLRPFRSLYVSGEDLGIAMLQATALGVRGRVVRNREIRDIADSVTGSSRRRAE